jgi:predicted RNA methylase
MQMVRYKPPNAITMPLQNGAYLFDLEDLAKMLAPRRTLHSTPLVVFRKALEIICATKNDVLYDVGCGDGRCVVDAATRLQIRSIGIEIDPDRAAQASAAVRDAGVEELATIIIGNAMEYDFEDATIIFLFLIERGLR